MGLSKQKQAQPHKTFYIKCSIQDDTGTLSSPIATANNTIYTKKHRNL